MDDPLVESCSFDLESLEIEIALAAHVARRDELAADWRRRFSRRARRG